MRRTEKFLLLKFHDQNCLHFSFTHICHMSYPSPFCLKWHIMFERKNISVILRCIWKFNFWTGLNTFSQFVTFQVHTEASLCSHFLLCHYFLSFFQLFFCGMTQYGHCEGLGAFVALTRPYVHTHFAVGCVLLVALKSRVLMQQGKWLHHPPALRRSPPLSISCCRWHLGPISCGNSHSDAMPAVVYTQMSYHCLPSWYYWSC